MDLPESTSSRILAVSPGRARTFVPWFVVTFSARLVPASAATPTRTTRTSDSKLTRITGKCTRPAVVRGTLS